MTVGLGADDGFVIPVDTMQWESEKRLFVAFDRRPGGPRPTRRVGGRQGLRDRFASTRTV